MHDTLACCRVQAVQAAQLTFEDFFMADLNIAPIKVGYTSKHSAHEGRVYI